jgi:autotransporter translocation and assembly factor TamB
VSVVSARLPDPITVAATRIELGGSEVRVPGVEVHFGGDVRATVAGRVHDIDWSRPDAAALEGKLTATADGRELGRWLGDGATSAGMARFAGQVSGPVGAPRIVGQASFDNLTVSWPRSPVGAVHVNGPIAIDGREIAVGPLMVQLENGGWLKIAGSQGAGRLTVARGGALVPVHGADLTIEGGGLGTMRPVAGLSVNDLALGLRLAEDGINRVRLTGDVRLGHNVLDVRELRKGATAEGAEKPKPAPAKRPTRQPGLLDRITVDVRVTGPDDAVRVRVPYAPEVTVGLNCNVRGVLASPRISGKVRGSGAYSRAALATADRFTERDLRGCDFGPR